MAEKNHDLCLFLANLTTLSVHGLTRAKRRCPGSKQVNTPGVVVSCPATSLSVHEGPVSLVSTGAPCSASHQLPVKLLCVASCRPWVKLLFSPQELLRVASHCP